MEDCFSRLQQFSKLDFRSKQTVISEGRPTPQLKGIPQVPGQRNRSFQTEWYKRKDWLCGCPTRNRLYCFPCLLFSSCDNVWTNSGYCDWKNLQRSLCVHERSAVHIQSQISWKTFGNPRIDLVLDEQRRLDVRVHNSAVRENREVLKDLINATCFLATQWLLFDGDGDGERLNFNCSNFVEVLHAFAERDEKLARYLKTSTVFSELSTGLETDLIEAVADVIRQEIKKEIVAAPFVAVEVVETCDVTNQARIAVILRYVCVKDKACEVKEAFLGVSDVNVEGPAPAIAVYVMGVLEKYNCAEKLVAQSYDGATVTSSQLNQAQAKMTEKVPKVTFTQCRTYDLDLLLMQSAGYIPNVRTFFRTVEGLGEFFSKSTKRSGLLDNVVRQRSPQASPPRWSSRSRLLQVVSTHLSEFRAVFRIISENPDSWDHESLMMAAGYERWLSRTSTCFLLMVYEGVFKEIDSLEVLRNRAVDTDYCCAQIYDTVSVFEGMRQEFGEFYEKFQQKCNELGLTDGGSKETSRDEKKSMYWIILDSVSAQVRALFDHYDELAFLGLVDCTKFHKLSKQFDDSKLQSLSKYSRFFDLVRLKADLVGLYSSKALRNVCKSPEQLLSFLVQKDLLQTVPEASKLLQLALTLPATRASEERSLSALKRLKTYRSDDRPLSSLVLISMETERLSKLRENKKDFYNQVIELFVEKNQRVDFIYK